MAEIAKLGDWQIREATGLDSPGIRGLLEESALPISDIEVSRPKFIVAYAGQALIGVGGFERFGDTGLLRSVAVKAGSRGTGLGRAIVGELERRARESGICEFVLLTESAQSFFGNLGYGVIERHSAPREIRQSVEFRCLCPQSAQCMSKRLAPGSSHD